MDAYYERKKEVLVKVCGMMEERGFNSLRNIYLDIIPKTIKISSPIQLFHYLDVGNCLNMRELLHNMKALGYLDDIEFFEEFVKEKPPPTLPNIQSIITVLKQGLRLIDLKDISYFIGCTEKITEFHQLFTLLLPIIYGNLCHLPNKKHLLSKIQLPPDLVPAILNIIQQPDSPQLRKGCINYFPLYREVLYKLAIDMDCELSFNALGFVYNIPINIFEDIHNPIDLFWHLENEGLLNLNELLEHLYIIGRHKLANRIKIFIEGRQGGNYSNISLNMCKLQLITAEMKTFCEENYTNAIEVYEDLLLKWFYFFDLSCFDIFPLINIMRIMGRYDLLRILGKIKELGVPKQFLEGQITKEHNRLFRLKFYLNCKMMYNLCKLYGVDKAFLVPVDFLTFLIVHDFSNISILKKNLTKIGREDLCPLLDCYYDE